MNRFRLNLYFITAIIALGGYSFSKSAPWVGVQIGPEEIRRADSLEKEFRIHTDKPAPKNVSWFKVARGKKNIIVTAPHATQPMRNGVLRFADKGTGSLAIMLHQLADVTVLYTTWPSPCDPNSIDHCDFKDSLFSLIKEMKPVLILDLHSSNPERPYDVDFGTMNGKSIQPNSEILLSLAQALSENGLSNQSLDFFKADQNQTITKFANQNKIESIQVEINAVWLKPDGDAMERHRYSQLLNALVQFLRSRP